MKDLWERLAESDKPIVLYGTGNGADRIADELEARHIPIAGVFASDGFVRFRRFRGHRVRSYAETVKTFGNDIVILIAFGSSRPAILDRFFALDARHETYAPDVPPAGGPLFDTAFYKANGDNLAEARALFSDEKSLSLFDAIVEYRLSGRLEPLTRALSDPEEIWQNVLRPDRYRITLDLGAYTGDTARELLERAPSVETVIALEPDEKNFARLCLHTAGGRVEPHYGAAWSEKTVLTFRSGAGRGSRLVDRPDEAATGGPSRAGKLAEVAAYPPDLILADRKVDFIKFDVEGAEREALLGCREAVGRCAPDLQVALYHKSEDLFALPLLVRELRPTYRLFLRRFPSVPGWELNLFALEP